MEHFRKHLLRYRPSSLWALATKGRALLSVLHRPLRRRPQRDHLTRPDTQRSRAAVPDLMQPNIGSGTFTGAQTFQDLFQRLDAKRVLWGSQKRYTAKELKVLINRVRTNDPRLRLPLEVIPETGGLRQRVQALAAAEAVANRSNDHRDAA